jgi:diguanylate cyclase (GGDEF)-like protein
MERHGGPLSFVMSDVDHFKKVNDTYGHNVGDRLLQEVAKALAQQCREVDLPARYGGEEFAIVVPDEPVSSAVHLAERCRQAVENVSLAARGETVRATASFGVADAPGPPSPEALVERADEALYQAKGAGRNRVQWCGTPGKDPSGLQSCHIGW